MSEGNGRDRRAENAVAIRDLLRSRRREVRLSSGAVLTLEVPAFGAVEHVVRSLGQMEEATEAERAQIVHGCVVEVLVACLPGVPREDVERLYAAEGLADGPLTKVALELIGVPVRDAEPGDDPAKVVGAGESSVPPMRAA